MMEKVTGRFEIKTGKFFLNIPRKLEDIYENVVLIKAPHTMIPVDGRVEFCYLVHEKQEYNNLIRVLENSLKSIDLELVVSQE